MMKMNRKTNAGRPAPREARIPDEVVAGFQLAGAQRKSPHRFAVPGRRRVELRLGSVVGPWLRFESSSFAPLAPGGGSALFVEDAYLPAAPIKLLPGKKRGTVRLIADLPLDAFERSAQTAGHDPLPESFFTAPVDGIALASLLGGLPDGANDRKVWAVDVMGALLRLTGDVHKTGERLEKDDNNSEMTKANLAERLERRGWVCSTTPDGTLSVTLASEHTFNQVRIDLESPDGVALDLELAEAADWNGTSFGAVLEICRQANARLRLVRLALRGSGNRRRILAQVRLGRIPPVSGWVDLALDALRVTAVMLSEALPALGTEPTLATWVLKSAAARSVRRRSLRAQERR